jgi:hypothetical protein
MPMQLIETKILPNAVHMRFVDDLDPQKADYWIDFQVPLDDLMLPSPARNEHLPEEVEKWYLGSIRLAALRYALDALVAQTEALTRRVGH